MIGGVKLAVAWVMPVLIIVISCDWCQQQLCTQTPATTVQQEGESQEESQKLFWGWASGIQIILQQTWTALLYHLLYETELIFGRKNSYSSSLLMNINNMFSS